MQKRSVPRAERGARHATKYVRPAATLASRVESLTTVRVPRRTVTCSRARPLSSDARYLRWTSVPTLPELGTAETRGAVVSGCTVLPDDETESDAITVP